MPINCNNLDISHLIKLTKKKVNGSLRCSAAASFSEPFIKYGTYRLKLGAPATLHCSYQVTVPRRGKTETPKSY